MTAVELCDALGKVSWHARPIRLVLLAKPLGELLLLEHDDRMDAQDREQREDVAADVVGEGRISERAQCDFHVPRVADDCVDPLVEQLASRAVRFELRNSDENGKAQVLRAQD